MKSLQKKISCEYHSFYRLIFFLNRSRLVKIGWLLALGIVANACQNDFKTRIKEANDALNAANANPDYFIIYDVNGATGGTVPADASPYKSGQTATVLGNTGNLIRTGFAFTGWNTAADGSGPTYATGGNLAVAGNTTLYAKWEADTIAPTVGTVISFSNVLSTTMTVSWGAASDNVAPVDELQYKLVRASSAAEIDTIPEVDAISGADLLMDYAANTTTFNATGLTGDIEYNFAVVVRDGAGLKALYATQSQSTAKPAGTGTPTHTDISAGQGTNSGREPAAIIDSVNNKLLAVTRNQANSNKPSLYRCDLNGGNCTHTDISAGQGTGSGYTPSVVIDSVNSKLLAVTRNQANSNKPSLFRCDLDGTGCTHVDISAGEGSNSGLTPAIAIDSANNKLLVVTSNSDNSSKPGLFRCNLDGSMCTHTDISAGQGSNSGLTPAIAIDSANNKLIVVSQNGANNNKPGLFRCDLDGTGCAHTDISAGQGYSSGTDPGVVVDNTNNKLLVVTRNNDNTGKPSLFRCNLDGSSCTHTDISAGQGSNSGFSPTAAIDSVNSKLLVVTQNNIISARPGLFRCELDGTGCTHTNISAGQGSSSGISPAALIDTVSEKLLVVTFNDANDGKLSLFRN